MTTLSIGWASQLLTSVHLPTFDPWIVAASSRGAQGTVVSLGLGLAAILMAIIYGIYLLDRYRRGLPVNDSKSLFRELCRVHDLTGAERRLLKRLAIGLEMSCPSALFVDSSLWRIPDGSDRHQRISKADWERLLKLQCVLFLPPPAKAVL